MKETVLVVQVKIQGQIQDFQKKLTEGFRQTAEIEDAAEQQAEAVYDLFIRRETEEYIWSAAGKLGIKTLGVSLTLDTDAPCPCPRAVALRGVYSASQQEALSMLLESELGLSPERQHWSNTDGD